MTTEISETQLVEEARRGGAAAFEELVRRCGRLVYARHYLETGDPHRAEDLTQETFLKALRSIHRLSEPAGFRRWLLAIAATVAIDAARREGRRKRSPAERAPEEALDTVPTRMASPEEDAEQAELRQKALALLRSLPEEQRLPLTLRYLGDGDYETIRRQLGVSSGALRGLLHRGLEALRKGLRNAAAGKK